MVGAAGAARDAKTPFAPSHHTTTHTATAYPWYTSVRTIMDDPAYSEWFIKFKANPPWFSPKCDNNFSPPRCSDYYHMMEQTPNYPTGDGDCAAPGCDCGTMPCAFYLWNHSSTAVVNGQTFQQWFIHSYMFNAVGSSPLVSVRVRYPALPRKRPARSTRQPLHRNQTPLVSLIVIRVSFGTTFGPG